MVRTLDRDLGLSMTMPKPTSPVIWFRVVAEWPVGGLLRGTRLSRRRPGRSEETRLGLIGDQRLPFHELGGALGFEEEVLQALLDIRTPLIPFRMSHLKRNEVGLRLLRHRVGALLDRAATTLQHRRESLFHLAQGLQNLLHRRVHASHRSGTRTLTRDWIYTLQDELV